MKVMWVCNIVLPCIAKQIGEPIKNTGGWLIGILDLLKKEENTEIAIVCPTSQNIEKQLDGLTCFGFLSPSIEKFSEYINKFKPDIIHIFGTETWHSHCMIMSAKKENMVNHTVVSIQGLVSVYAQHYTGYLSAKEVLLGMTIRDFIKGNIYRQQRQFVKKGVYEQDTIRLAEHIIGRTEWDKACVKRLNNNVNYYSCNESLRAAFYNHMGMWCVENCERHSIFVTQYGYPLKGFHLMLDALADVKKDFPDVKLYTTGKNLFALSQKELIMESFYHKYIRKKIVDLGLKDNVRFLGNLNEEEMSLRLLKTHVFVCPSSIENSPNSLGEAMMIGTPCISSDVGGVKSLFNDGIDGMLYPSDEPYMCAYYVKKIFRNDELAKTYSTNAVKHASITHDKIANNKKLLQIYEVVRGKSNETVL